MQYSLTTASVISAILSLASAAPMPQATAGTPATTRIVRELRGLEAGSTLTATLDATTVNNVRMRSAIVGELGPSPWCAGFEDAAATRPLDVIPGSVQVFDFENRAVYTEDVNGLVEVGSFWCALTRDEVVAFVDRANQALGVAPSFAASLPVTGTATVLPTDVQTDISSAVPIATETATSSIPAISAPETSAPIASYPVVESVPATPKADDDTWSNNGYHYNSPASSSTSSTHPLQARQNLASAFNPAPGFITVTATPTQGPNARVRFARDLPAGAADFTAAGGLFNAPVSEITVITGGSCTFLDGENQVIALPVAAGQSVGVFGFECLADA